MNKTTIPDALKKKLIPIMRNHSLAKFGDTLTNFLYSLAKTRVVRKPIGTSVLDKALAEVLRTTGLRAVMPSSSSAGTLGDGIEALIGHVFLEEIMPIEEMTTILVEYLQTVDPEQLEERSNERLLMIESFTGLIEVIIEKMSEE
ncbi:MAG: hypothetical protein FK733_14315 [Asgard group archaeon]|nr:hypothetical protein [Asgard group archaeon]